jgi:hypothetical protein
MQLVIRHAQARDYSLNCPFVCNYVGFEVLTAVVMNVIIFSDIAPCSRYVNRRFGITHHLHLQGRILVPATHWFLARLIFGPEDGGDSFLRNVGPRTNYSVLYPRRWKHSCF